MNISLLFLFFYARMCRFMHILTFWKKQSFSNVAKVFFFLMYQKFYINKSRPDVQPSRLPYFLFLSVTIACSADTVTLTLPRAPFLTLPQLLLAFLFKAVCVSTYASWHKYLSDLLATSTGCVPGKHRVTTFTRRKKRRGKKTGRERGLASPEGRLTKKLSEHWRLSLPPAVWLGWVLVAVQLQF